MFKQRTKFRQETRQPWVKHRHQRKLHKQEPKAFMRRSRREIKSPTTIYSEPTPSTPSPSNGSQHGSTAPPNSSRPLPAKPRLLDHPRSHLLHIPQALRRRRPQPMPSASNSDTTTPSASTPKPTTPTPLPSAAPPPPVHILNRMLAGHTPSTASPTLLRLSITSPHIINELGVCKRPQPAVQTNCCPIIGSQDWCHGFQQSNPSSA